MVPNLLYMLNNNTRDALYRRFFSLSSQEEGGYVADGIDSEDMAVEGIDSEGGHIERKDVIFPGENKLDRTQGFHFSSPKKICIYSRTRSVQFFCEINVTQ